MLVDLAIIPLIYIVQVALSYLCSIIVAKAFRFGKRPRNFVIAMAVRPIHFESFKVPSKLTIARFLVIQILYPFHWSSLYPTP